MGVHAENRRDGGHEKPCTAARRDVDPLVLAPARRDRATGTHGDSCPLVVVILAKPMRPSCIRSQRVGRLRQPDSEAEEMEVGARLLIMRRRLPRLVRDDITRAVGGGRVVNRPHLGASGVISRSKACLCIKALD
jgi:hypothetical protein